VYFDRDASTKKACRLIEHSGEQGATLAAFSETWLHGYPFFVASPPTALWWKAAAEYLADARRDTQPHDRSSLCGSSSGEHRCVIGVVELDQRTRGTVYCTLLFIRREGEILGRHRKLDPTHVERSIWGEGDALGLKVYERP
jgi:nitrilase